VLYIDHAKAKSSEESILEVNAVPAPHSKGLLQQAHPGNTPSLGLAAAAATQKQAAAGVDGNSSQSSDDDEELGEAAAAAAGGAGGDGAAARGGGDPMAADAMGHSKL
jgi:hypothetical protein